MNVSNCHKAKGIKKTIALAEIIDYSKLSHSIGIHSIINKKLLAANNIFKQNLGMKDMRGKIYTYKRIPCIVTYHPAAVLRNPDWRRPVWDDIKKVKQLINI